MRRLLALFPLVASILPGLLPGLLLVACTSTAPPPAAPPAAEVAADAVLPSLPDSTHWVRNSAEYRAAALQTFRLAAELLAAQTLGRDPGTWAVILDADETILDNSLYQKELAARGGTYDRESWHDWTMRREAMAVPGAAAFLAEVEALGGHIAIVTNRTVAQCPATEEVMRRHGLAYDVVLCRGESSDKAARWQSVTDGTASPELPALEVVMWLGDNIHDFPGLDQSNRLAGDAPFAAFGDRYILLPNPMYGSWLENPRR